MIDRAKLRETIRCNVDVLCRTLFPSGKRVGNEWQIGNTAGDPGDSLGIRLTEDKAGVWIDRATGERGDFVKLLELHFTFGYREAADWIGRTLGISFEISEEEAGERKRGQELITLPASMPAPVVQEEPPPILSPADLKRMARAAHTLARNPELFFTVLGPRPEISLEAIRGAALDGDLGYEANCQFGSLSGPAVLLGYSHGLKARWSTDLLGERHIRWLVGTPAKQCWRQSLLRRDHRSVFIFEGETDALAALSAGVEEEDPECLVVGLAAAQILPRPEPYAGRRIVIVPDPGGAGDRSSKKLLDLFGPIAESVTILEGGLAV